MKERFFLKVQKTGTCWLWTGSKNKQGYGYFKVNGKVEKAHRISYFIHNGKIPNKRNILHSCDNPFCVNPKHLFAGTQSENMIDCVKKKRHQNQILTEKQIPIIRKMYKEGKSQVEIGRKFGVARETIKNVITNIRWAYVS